MQRRRTTLCAVYHECKSKGCVFSPTSLRTFRRTNKHLQRLEHLWTVVGDPIIHFINFSVLTFSYSLRFSFLGNTQQRRGTPMPTLAKITTLRCFRGADKGGYRDLQVFSRSAYPKSALFRFCASENREGTYQVYRSRYSARRLNRESNYSGDPCFFIQYTFAMFSCLLRISIPGNTQRREEEH